MRRCTDSQMRRCTDAQMHGCTNAQRRKAAWGTLKGVGGALARIKSVAKSMILLWKKANFWVIYILLLKCLQGERFRKGPKKIGAPKRRPNVLKVCQSREFLIKHRKHHPSLERYFIDNMWGRERSSIFPTHMCKLLHGESIWSIPNRFPKDGALFSWSVR